LTFTLRDKLNYVSVLKAASRPGKPGAVCPKSELPPELDQLAQLLGAVSRRNRYGEHFQVRKTLAARKADLLPLIDLSRTIGMNAPSSFQVLLRTSNITPCPPEEWLFLDTETTGLAGGTGTYAFLVGMAQVVDGRIELEQFFMRDFREESSMLAEVATRLVGKPLLITFNGKAFDWPLLETRFRMQRMRLEQPPALHLDLLHPSRHLWRAQLGSASLADLERGVLGIRRENDVPGERIPRIYFDYLRGGRAEPMVEVFRHNENDLLALVGLTANLLAMLAGDGERKPSALESYGLSRLFQLAGWREAAREHYEKAVAAELPGELRCAAQRALAGLYKRERNYDRANQLWEELLDVDADLFRASEELAIFYEHHARDYERAATIVRQAISRLRAAVRRNLVEPHQHRRLADRLEYRLKRLQQKRTGLF